MPWRKWRGSSVGWIWQGRQKHWASKSRPGSSNMALSIRRTMDGSMATRRFILSPSNPYFYEGTFKGEEISGIGSPHTPAGMIWPLAQEMLGMTTNQGDE